MSAAVLNGPQGALDVQHSIRLQVEMSNWTGVPSLIRNLKVSPNSFYTCIGNMKVVAIYQLGMCTIQFVLLLDIVYALFQVKRHIFQSEIQEKTCLITTVNKSWGCTSEQSSRECIMLNHIPLCIHTHRFSPISYRKARFSWIIHEWWLVVGSFMTSHHSC